jgi:indole-3-acetate monooxygenase
MAVSEKLTGNDILEAARALAPQICGAEEIECERRLPLPLVQAMKDAGIFRMPMPCAWGGPEVDPLTQIRIVEALSAADPSVGWCAMIGSDGGYFSAFLEDAVGRALSPDLDLVTGSSTRPTGRAMVAAGGYRVSGRWQLSSGCQHSTYLVGNCFVFDDPGQRRLEDGTPESRLCYLPAARCEILDTGLPGW